MRISDWSSDVCSSDLFQQAVVDCLIDRTRLALEAMPEATALVVAGGVASNQAIRAALGALADAQGLPFIAPPGWLCTDNAAMIAWAGAERSEEHTSELQSLMRISYAVFCLKKKKN